VLDELVARRVELLAQASVSPARPLQASSSVTGESSSIFVRNYNGERFTLEEEAGLQHYTTYYHPKSGGTSFKVTVVRPKDPRSGSLIGEMRRLNALFAKGASSKPIDTNGYLSAIRGDNPRTGIVTDLGNTFIITTPSNELPAEKILDFLRQLPLAKLRDPGSAI